MRSHLALVAGRHTGERRQSTRRAVRVPARIIWRDARGVARIASVITRDASDEGLLVECLKGPPIPLFRLVDVHLDRVVRDHPDLPPVLRRAQVLAAVFRVGPYSPVTGSPEYYALRLLVKPERRRPLTHPFDPSSPSITSDAEPCRSLTA